ncbi:uracil-DNA glycosylase [Wolbachia endosymbiont of Atemnus politus]|uniref:uracil-DNA glycosylase n=1 Tax=Wolbachia endosymbiont of Atemnus politus TaxID=2682840 RepID=UPI00157359FE|nr:uracil-DNA glycosylase [Wolbachia endosymbiont of Atemnus politus]NSM56679.1 uracil-DNA glycosylase [Wolbachia endosymbiont of Atemnus politus]NSX83783.1 uracil-DNA glycosylase [Wolbachia endosymbiont of Atemnus politus]
MSNEDLELLKFYHEEGIDCTLTEGEEEKETATKENSGLAQSPAIEAEAQKKEQQSMFPSDWIVEARKLASKCSSVDELRSAAESFEGCEIKKTATNTVFSDGNPNAKIMLVGEAPGANEDLQGIPFCGASGMLLDKMLNAINLDRTTVYISNTVFWRPPGNRKPSDLELDMCRPFVEKHIALVSPQILILVGGIACYSLLDNTKTISTLRGRFHTYTNQYLSHSVVTAAIFHPAYLLRQPAQKRLAWEDLKKIREYLNNNCTNI